MNKCFIVQDGSSNLKAFRLDQAKIMLDHIVAKCGGVIWEENKELFSQIMDGNYAKFNGSLNNVSVSGLGGGIYLATII